MYKSATLVFAYDWQGIYVNGKLQAENHNIIGDRHAVCQMLQELEVNFSVIDSDSYPHLEDYLAERGNLPQTLAELIAGLNDLKI